MTSLKSCPRLRMVCTHGWCTSGAADRVRVVYLMSCLECACANEWDSAPCGGEVHEGRYESSRSVSGSGVGERTT